MLQVNIYLHSVSMPLHII